MTRSKNNENNTKGKAGGPARLDKAHNIWSHAAEAVAADKPSAIELRKGTLNEREIWELAKAFGMPAPHSSSAIEDLKRQLRLEEPKG